MKLTATRAVSMLTLAVFTALALLFPVSAPAQETRGTITGKVTDAGGAVVPGAAVRVGNQAMGTSVQVTTNDAGLFQAPYLLPGTYQVTVEVGGFKKYVRDGVILR
ncbi:MAG TPA: carboxypeptidase-like regulatory domain-containing protein, partial [Blastocatellia bacterium]|nr:carboxypeptidase-like regulatory domain-containing protein [Blastocatellia bacterium]